MKKWALLSVAMVLATAVLGWSTRDEEVVATSGAQIKVIKAEKGYVLEVSWSGGQEEDIAILRVVPRFPAEIYQREHSDLIDPTREGHEIVWHARRSGTIRIPVAFPDPTPSWDGDFRGGYAAISFCREPVIVRVFERDDTPQIKGGQDRPTKLRREIEFSSSAIGAAPRVILATGADLPFEAPTASPLRYEIDAKTETTRFGIGGLPLEPETQTRKASRRTVIVSVAW
jgi:hypothetical protein